MTAAKRARPHLAAVPEAGAPPARAPALADFNPLIIDTLRESPDMLNASASRERLELASKVGALSLGADAAETIGARNSLEKMLAHQMAASHAQAMTFLARAKDLLHRHEYISGNQSTFRRIIVQRRDRSHRRKRTPGPCGPGVLAMIGC